MMSSNNNNIASENCCGNNVNNNNIVNASSSTINPDNMEISTSGFSSSVPTIVSCEKLATPNEWWVT